MTLKSNVSVVAGLLSCYAFTSTLDLQAAVDELSKGIRLSMEHTNAYTIPIDQALPAEASPATAAPYLHPNNIATALVNVARAGNLAIDPALLVYNPPSGWVTLASVTDVEQVQVTITQPAPPPPPPAAPPSIPPPPAPPSIPPPPAPPAGPVPSIADLVEAAITGGAPAAPSAISTPQQYADYRAAQGHPPIDSTATRVDVVAPSAVAATPTIPVVPLAPAPGADAQAQAAVAASNAHAGTPTTQHVTLQQARAEADNAEAVGLPDASIMAERRSSAGRPQKSPFEREVKGRNKLAPPPFWWSFFAHSAKQLFVESPAQALDPGSTGSGPVQAYALLVSLQQEVLRCVDGNLTVAELRAYLREIDTAMSALPSKDAIYQLATSLFSDAALKGSEE